MHNSSNYPKGEVNYPWHMDSRNKRSIVLDLKKPDARAALDRLIAISDVLICNFPPLVRDKLKLGYDDVKRVNPEADLRLAHRLRRDAAPTATGRASTPPPTSPARAFWTPSATKAGRPACRCRRRAIARRPWRWSRRS